MIKEVNPNEGRQIDSRSFIKKYIFRSFANVQNQMTQKKIAELFNVENTHEYILYEKRLI